MRCVSFSQMKLFRCFLIACSVMAVTPENVEQCAHDYALVITDDAVEQENLARAFKSGFNSRMVFKSATFKS